jgi:hypothetical protein
MATDPDIEQAIASNIENVLERLLAPVALVEKLKNGIPNGVGSVDMTTEAPRLKEMSRELSARLRRFSGTGLQ